MWTLATLRSDKTLGVIFSVKRKRERERDEDRTIFDLRKTDDFSRLFAPVLA